jgi:polyphenol oxidase
MLIPFAFPGVPAVRAVFTARPGGASQGPFAGANFSWDVGDDADAVARNRQALSRELGCEAWAEARQVHGVNVLVDPLPGGVLDRFDCQADGLTTSRAGVVLAVKTADCQPILLAHVSGRHVAALHCGWRGNRQLFPQKGVAAFCRAWNISSRDVLAVRGPSLGPAASEFIHFQKEWGDAFRGYFDPAPQTVDLWRLTRDQLVQAGLVPERIFSLDLCTYSLASTFFSYRRASLTGRQLGLIWIAAS